jgi:hypothetical protein
MRQEVAKNARLLECDAVLMGEHLQCSKGSEDLDTKYQGGEEHHQQAMKLNLSLGLEIKCKSELEAMSFPYSSTFSAH